MNHEHHDMMVTPGTEAPEVVMTGDDHSQHMTDHSSHSEIYTDSHSLHSGMSMFFHLGYSEVVLFYGWRITTVAGLIASCCGLFVLAVLYEALKYKREDMLRKSASASSELERIRVPSENGTTEVVTVAPPQRMRSVQHWIQTLLHGLQVVLGYMLMLVFMTYNIWLGLSIVLGAMVGYFIFGSKKFVVVDVSEHCH